MRRVTVIAITAVILLLSIALSLTQPISYKFALAYVPLPPTTSIILPP